MRYRYLVGLLVFALVVSVFAVQNSQLVNIELFFWTIPSPLVYVIFGTALASLITGVLLGSMSRRKTSQSYSQAGGASHFSITGKGNKTPLS